MKSINLKYLPAQLDVIEDIENLKNKYFIISKGRRFGFTRGLMQASIEWMLEGQKILWGDTIHANLIKYVERYAKPVLNSNGIEYEFNKQEKTLKIGSGYMDLRSADNPENWEGFGYDKIILNEAGIILQNKYLYVNAVLPMLLDNPNSKLIAGGVPKGRKSKVGGEHLFYTLHKKASVKPEKYKSYIFTSYDNNLLSEQDIKELEEEMGEMDDETIKQEIYGEFINSKTGLVYIFDRTIHHTDKVADEKSVLHIGMDFNITNMSAVVHIIENNKYYAVDEFVEVYDTHSMVERIRERYPKNYIIIYPDASGQNRHSSGKTDVQILQQAGFKIKVGSKNPFVRDRVNEVNKQFRDGNYFVNLKKCSKLAEALEQIGYKGGEPDKTSGYDHLTDSAGYFVFMQKRSTIGYKG